MRPVLPPCSTEALKIRYAALGGVLSGDGSPIGTHSHADERAWSRSDQTRLRGALVLQRADWPAS